MTEKQYAEERRSVKDRLVDLRVTLEFSIKTLEAYATDLNMELKDVRKAIRRSHAKLKTLRENVERANQGN